MDFSLNISCGADNTPVSDYVELLSSIEPKEVILETTTQEDGRTNIYWNLDEDFIGRKVYISTPNLPISEIEIKAGTNTHNFDLHHGSCLPQTQKTLSKETAPVRVSIGSAENPMENKKVVIEDEGNSQKINWELSPDNPKETLQIVEEYADGTNKEYEANLGNGDQTTIGNIQIAAKIVKKVKEVYAIDANDEASKIILYDIDTGYQNPEIELRNEINFFKVVTIYNDNSQEEDSSFYIEKAQQDFLKEGEQ